MPAPCAEDDDSCGWSRSVPRFPVHPSARSFVTADVAAHAVLLEYFPASQKRLDNPLLASLAGIPDGPQKTQGMRYGERAADRLIKLRENDTVEVFHLTPERTGCPKFEKVVSMRPSGWRRASPAYR